MIDLERIGTFMRWCALVMVFVGFYFAAPMLDSGFEWKQCRDAFRLAISDDSNTVSAQCREMRASVGIGVGLMGCSVLLAGLGKMLRNIGLRRRSGESG